MHKYRGNQYHNEFDSIDFGIFFWNDFMLTWNISHFFFQISPWTYVMYLWIYPAYAIWIMKFSNVLLKMFFLSLKIVIFSSKVDKTISSMMIISLPYFPSLFLTAHLKKTWYDYCLLIYWCYCCLNGLIT